MAGETILCPPGPPLKGKPLILDVLAIPAVEGELHESSGSPRAIVKWGESAGWICPPCGSLKALSRSVETTVISSGARSVEITVISSEARSAKPRNLISPRASLGRNDSEGALSK